MAKAQKVIHMYKSREIVLCGKSVNLVRNPITRRAENVTVSLKRDIEEAHRRFYERAPEPLVAQDTGKDE